MATNDNQGNKENDEVALFEAISHPVRIQILFSLHESPLGFSDLKRKVGISSSGNLQHHLGKLASLIVTNDSADYTLTDQGRESIVAIKAVRNIQNGRSEDVGLVTFVTSLVFYVTYINVQFLLGPVDILIPLETLVSVLVFAPVFYFIYSWRLRKSRDI